MKPGHLVGDIIYHRLVSVYQIDYDEFVAPRIRDRSLFEFLIAVLLSQNTNDKNAWRAYMSLKQALGEITPDIILSHTEDDIAELIKYAGMHHNRAKRIKELAMVFRETNIEETILNYIRSGQLDQARRVLLSLPGIGYKTADVTLLMHYGMPFFPVDTHILRITRRLGFVDRVDYESVSRYWLENTSPRNYLGLHLLLITHGRKTCKARNPRCNDCIIRDLCNYGAGR